MPLSDITIVALTFCTGIAFIYGVEGLSLTHPRKTGPEKC